MNRGAGPGPKIRLTRSNYRKKSLPFLLSDFQKRCAYCLDPDDFRHPALNHVDHFNCKLRERKRHQYRNLMLACAACNQVKHDKPIVNPLDPRQRLLNCTEENEFPKHIREDDNGAWQHLSDEGEYHLTTIGLQEPCHTAKRRERRRNANQVLALLKQAVQYQSINPVSLHRTIMEMVHGILSLLDNFPPLVTEHGMISVRDWLKQNGVNADLLDRPRTN